MAAYSRLASQSQAKFQTTKLSPLSALQAAAPAQSTISTCSFDFRLARVRMWIWHTLSQWPFPGIFEARNEVSWWLLTSLVSRSQEWAFFHVTFDIKRLLFRLVYKVIHCLSTKQDGGTTWPIFSGCGTPNCMARLHGTGRLHSVMGPAGWRLGREAQLKFPTRRRMTGRLGGWRVSRGAWLSSEWRARDRGRPSRRGWSSTWWWRPIKPCWPSTWWWRPSRSCWPSTWWWRPGRCGQLTTPSGLDNGRPSWDPCSGRGPSTSCQAFERRASKSKRAMTATSSGSKATEVEQSAVRPSRSRQPKKSVASSVSVVGWPSRRVRTPQITKWVPQAEGDQPVVQGTPAGNTPAAR